MAFLFLFFKKRCVRIGATAGALSLIDILQLAEDFFKKSALLYSYLCYVALKGYGLMFRSPREPIRILDFVIFSVSTSGHRSLRSRLLKSQKTPPPWYYCQ